MRRFRPVRRNLRSSILATFSTLLFFSFALVGLGFNIAANQYIHYSAINALTDARNAHWVGLTADGSDERFLAYTSAQGRDITFFHRNIRRFYLNADHQLEGVTTVSYEVVSDITSVLIAEDLNIANLEPLRIRVNGNVYYIAAIASMVRPPNTYAIHYINTTDLQRFTAGINLRTLWLVAMIWVTAMLLSTYLAGSLAKPLRNLSAFARQIGQGDFTPNPINFANEEFEELNQSLNHTAKQLARYDNEQKTFFQNVSHELRTPLMSIKSYAEGIKHGIMDPAMASETILECTDRLTDMVGDVLYVSRIDNITPPAMEEINFTALTEERVARQRALAERKGLTIVFKSDGEPIAISCVPNYIERAVDNLISNAIRYATNTITIECYAIGSKAIIRVLDDGPGFEPDKLPHVFERFFKGKNGLTGIGLSIVKSVVEQHKGTATAENGVKGAVLTISLPRAKNG